MTFVVSAIWHGTYPGFFVLFVGAIFVEITSVNLSKSTLVKGLGRVFPNPVNQVLSWLSIWPLMSFLACAFIFLDWEHFVIYSYNFNFVPHISLATLFLISFILPKERKPREKNSKTD